MSQGTRFCLPLHCRHVDVLDNPRFMEIFDRVLRNVEGLVRGVQSSVPAIDTAGLSVKCVVGVGEGTVGGVE